MINSFLSRLWYKTNSASPQPTEYYERILRKIPFDNSPINKIIHQTYYTDSLPEEIAQNIEFLKRNNPGYSYKLWLDEEIEDFIKKEYGDEILKYGHMHLNLVKGKKKERIILDSLFFIRATASKCKLLIINIHFFSNNRYRV